MTLGPFYVAPSGDTSGATDFATLSAVMAKGGRVYLADDAYYCNAPLVASAPVCLQGAGSSDGYPSGGDTAPTSITFTGATAAGLTLQGPGSIIDAVHIRNGSSTLATAGAGIILAGAHGASINRCSTRGFYYSVDVQNAQAYAITDNKLFSPARSCIHIANAVADEGDPIISGNQLIAGGLNNATPLAAVIFAAGGGVKFIGNKINREGPALSGSFWFRNGLLFQPTNNVQTGVFVLNDNSMENTLQDIVFLDGSLCTSGSAFLHGFIIVGNECAAPSGFHAVRVAGSAFCGFQDILIDSLHSNYGGGGLVNLVQYCTNVMLGQLSAKIVDAGTPVVYIGSGGGAAQVTATVTDVNYDLARINVRVPAPSQTLVTDFTQNATDNHVCGSRTLSHDREIPNLGVAPSTTNLGTFSFGANQSARLKVSVSANLTGIGPFAAVAERVFTSDGSKAVTATSVGSDFSTASNTLLIGFNTGVAGAVTVTLTTVVAGGSGRVRFEIDGTAQGYVRA